MKRNENPPGNESKFSDEETIPNQHIISDLGLIESDFNLIVRKAH